MEKKRTYIAIDLKSFYSSVECVDKGLDPLRTNLVVADKSRTEKTICLAVTPSLKAYGISGRARLFEVVQRVKEINAERLRAAPGHTFVGRSSNAVELDSSPSLALDYIVAPPRMARYMEVSTQVYQTYLKYVAPEDIHPYSVDEVFMDVTSYLRPRGVSPREFAIQMIRDVLKTTGITATAGIASNLYLAKIAMDIMAKHLPGDKDGVRIAELDEMSYRRLLWAHQPLTDFWRVGPGYARKLASAGLYTMGDVARCSIGRPEAYHNQALLYRLFGVNAELLIDHAWGYEPCTIADIKAYRPMENSLGAGQVLHCPYPFNKARLIIHEMAEQLSLDLVAKGLCTDQIVVTVGYDRESLSRQEIASQYSGPVVKDHYGREVPKHAHGSQNLRRRCSSTKLIVEAAIEIFDRVVNPSLLVRRLNITATHVVPEADCQNEPWGEQLDLFSDTSAKKAEELAFSREKKKQKAMLEIKERYGKNAILKGMNLLDGATAKDRNEQIGGHKA